jgi:predicted dehydrogenase
MKRYRIVVAGCGNMAHTWLDYAAERDDAVIVGMVDIREENARAMAERRGLNVPTFADLESALKATDANLVFDITVPASHKQVVSTALQAGCHVFGEKPMAESMEDARRLLELSQKLGKRYIIMQNRRYLRHLRGLRDFLRSGAVGTVGTIHADFFIGAHFGGFREVMDSPLIVDMAIHTFDQARFLSGADPVSVYCQEFNPPGSWYKGNASAVCIFEMSDGSVFCYRGSWCAEGFSTSWESDWRIIGSKGTVRWNGAEPPVCEVADGERPSAWMNPVKRIEVPLNWHGRQGHWGCLDEMFASLEQDRPAETDAADNIKSMAMVFGALESSRSGKKITL